MTILRARFRRWWHCLTTLHRMESGRHMGRTVYLGCECGYMFYKRGEWGELFKQALRYSAGD